MLGVKIEFFCENSDSILTSNFRLAYFSFLRLPMVTQNCAGCACLRSISCKIFKALGGIETEISGFKKLVFSKICAVFRPCREYKNLMTLFQNGSWCICSAGGVTRAFSGTSPPISHLTDT